MPSIKVWYCCQCNYGPLNVELDDSCPECNKHRRCHSCETSTISQRYSYHQGSREMATLDPYPEAGLTYACNTYTIKPAMRLSGMSFEGDPKARHSPPLDTTSMPPTTIVPGLGSTSSTDAAPCHDIFRHGGRIKEHPHAYYCCQCNDGPKLYDIQPICVACNHKACAFCRAA